MSKNPKLYNFKDEYVKTLKKDLQIDFLDNTEFLEAQIFPSFQDSSFSLLFKFPENGLNDFIKVASINYNELPNKVGEESLYGKIDKYFYHKRLGYTFIILYFTKDGYVKGFLQFTSPSNNIYNIFKKNL